MNGDMDSALLTYRYVDSPVGPLLLAEDEQGLRRIGFDEGKGKVLPAVGWREERDCCAEAARQLQEYFGGSRRQFELRLAPFGTEFQLEVLDALQTIPFGETRSYADIANQIGRPRAIRAVGAANGRNPLPIVIPCHRVIGSDGSLTGFGGGLATKSQLLKLEGIELPSFTQGSLF